ncbi:hypothetical protein ACTXT7_001845 [Hymenolepis weldensis]
MIMKVNLWTSLNRKKNAGLNSIQMSSTKTVYLYVTLKKDLLRRLQGDSEQVFDEEESEYWMVNPTKVRGELLNESSGDELATRKRKQHCQLSADPLRTPESVRDVHGMMDENPVNTQKNKIAFDLSPMKKSIEETIGGYVWATPLKFQLLCMRAKFPPTVLAFGVMKGSEGHIRTPQFFPQDLRVNADADAYVETPQTIVVKLP